MEQRQQQLEKQGTRKAAMESKRTSEPPQSCPRCESTNTKFCYYNNYSSSQPRYFCRTCRRYWTQGGTLRNLPHASSAVRRAVKQCKRPSSASFSVASVSTSVMPLYHRMSTGVERPPWCMSDGDELVRQPIGYEIVDSSMLVGSRIPPAQPQMAGVLNPAAGQEEDGVLGRVFGRFEDGSCGEGGDRRTASSGSFF